ncbi:MAG: indolepyruvate oxidoreductase [Candidatus Altiarchaeales archaeon]|nr:indolepyruvate oxidoreductase [Candidatus Altiarchaeales archaeon]
MGFVAGYPGTPSTEVIEYLLKHSPNRHIQWSVNEKVALETSAGACLSGVRSLCVMKHVGLNVAADPLMTLPYTGVSAGLVLVVADDPGMHSSQNEQDTRHYLEAAKTLGLEPKNPQEAYDMTCEAFRVSEELDLPLILRTNTQTAHTAAKVTVGEPRNPPEGAFRKDIERSVMIPQNARPARRNLQGKQKKINEYVEHTKYNHIAYGDSDTGVVAEGHTVNMACEFAGKKHSIMSIGTWPPPREKLTEFTGKHKKIIVFEEGDPLLERQINCLCDNVKGRLSGDLPLWGELLPRHAAQALEVDYRGTRRLKKQAPPRPPTLCPGCPHRGTYEALRKLGVDNIAGDIGCYSLGAQKPYEAMHTLLCMGAGINQAAGMNHVGVEQPVAVVGDSTFLHSGLTGLLNAAANHADMVLIIFNNHSTAMTGHQPTPLRGAGKIKLEGICKMLGADYVKTYDPRDHEETPTQIKKALKKQGLKVLIADAPCLFVE